ncbi:MAG: DUF3237 domain-containing protein [Thermoleophilaceae bacterium]|nr:DUF3237 domain-containing protein [Thermoleophilaceae bacterium]
MNLEVDLLPPQMIGTPFGARLTFVTTGGTFEGERLRGELLPGGGDWLEVGSDSVGHLNVRATLRTHDGELIHMQTRGVARLDEDARARFLSGGSVAMDEMYARTQLRFQTGAEDYAWLNSIVTVAKNEFGPNHVSYRVFEVL